MDRRHFLGGLLSAGALMALDPVGIAGEIGREKRPGMKKGSGDEDFVVFISDLHTNPSGYQSGKLRDVVDSILNLRPLPRAVVAFGDIAYLTGGVGEYENARDILAPLEAAGIRLFLGMGNHDRRDNFSTVFPGQVAASALNGRLVYVIEGRYADIIMLDSLQQGEDRSTWITPGALDDAQKEWLQTALNGYEKPVFVAAHHPLDEIGIADMLLRCPRCAGFIYGHNHKWMPDWLNLNYSSRRILLTLCLPSTGHWGDIGYVKFRMGPDEAVAELVQTDFYFPKPAADGVKPLFWERMMEKNRDASFSFIYQNNI